LAVQASIVAASLAVLGSFDGSVLQRTVGVGSGTPSTARAAARQALVDVQHLRLRFRDSAHDGKVEDVVCAVDDGEELVERCQRPARRSDEQVAAFEAGALGGAAFLDRLYEQTLALGQADGAAAWSIASRYPAKRVGRAAMFLATERSRRSAAAAWRTSRCRVMCCSSTSSR